MTFPESLALVRLCCRTLDEKKAGDLRVLDVSAQSSITDYLIIATATSEPHLRTLRIELEKVVDASGTRIVGIESIPESGWTVIDLFDVMIHLFRAETRRHYRLERLWKDAAEVPLAEILAVEKPKPARKPRVRKAHPKTGKAAKKKAPAAKRSTRRRA